MSILAKREQERLRTREKRERCLMPASSLSPPFLSFTLSFSLTLNWWGWCWCEGHRPEPWLPRRRCCCKRGCGRKHLRKSHQRGKRKWDGRQETKWKYLSFKKKATVHIIAVTETVWKSIEKKSLVLCQEDLSNDHNLQNSTSYSTVFTQVLCRKPSATLATPSSPRPSPIKL